MFIQYIKFWYCNISAYSNSLLTSTNPYRYRTFTCRPVQYIPRNMHTGFALLCFVVVIHWLIFPYPSGLLHWHCGNLTIAPVPAKQPWWIWKKYFMWIHYERLHNHNKAKHNKPVCIFLGIYCTYAGTVITVVIGHRKVLCQLENHICVLKYSLICIISNISSLVTYFCNISYWQAFARYRSISRVLNNSKWRLNMFR